MKFVLQLFKYLEDVPKNLGSAEEDGFIKMDLGTIFMDGSDDAGVMDKAELVCLPGAKAAVLLWTVLLCDVAENLLAAVRGSRLVMVTVETAGITTGVYALFGFVELQVP